MGLACGLQDQRLMARPPARAGGRSGSLTGGKSGKRNGFSPPFPKGYLSTSPARPAGGRAVTSVTKRGPQAGYPTRSTAFPHTTPPEKGVQREEPLPSGVLSPISSQEMGPRPGWPRSPPFQRLGGPNRDQGSNPRPAYLPGKQKSPRRICRGAIRKRKHFFRDGMAFKVMPFPLLSVPPAG